MKKENKFMKIYSKKWIDGISENFRLCPLEILKDKVIFEQQLKANTNFCLIKL